MNIAHDVAVVSKTFSSFMKYIVALALTSWEVVCPHRLVGSP